jgi:branched-subunit amino acid ABC-type transport system permease component
MDLSVELIAQLSWTGFAISSYYVLFAIAFALVLKINQVWNFGQAGLMVVAYFAMYVGFQRLDLPAPVVIPLTAIVTIAAAVCLEHFGFRVLRERNSSVLTFFIFTIMLSQCAIYLAELAFGTDPKTLFPSILWPVFLLGSIVVSWWDLMAVPLTIGMIGALYLFFRYTRDGQFLVAVADNPELAEMYGISRRRAYAVSMAIAALFMVAGMYLFGTRASIYPSTPLNQFLIFAVIATILAGIGNVFAAGLAALALSLIQSFSILVISSRWQILLVYVMIFIAILLFPRGVRLALPGRQIRRGAGAIVSPDAQSPTSPSRRAPSGEPVGESPLP